MENAGRRAARIAAMLLANLNGPKSYSINNRRAIHSLLDILLDDGAIFRVHGNGGGAHITVQFHSDEQIRRVEELLSGYGEPTPYKYQR